MRTEYTESSVKVSMSSGRDGAGACSEGRALIGRPEELLEKVLSAEALPVATFAPTMALPCCRAKVT